MHKDVEDDYVIFLMPLILATADLFTDTFWKNILWWFPFGDLKADKLQVTVVKEWPM